MADVAEKTELLSSLCVLKLPANLTNKKILKEHFSKFGNVKQIVLSSKNNSCIVNFDSHEQAKNALEYGKELDGNKLEIFWGRIKSRNITSTSQEESSKERRKSRHTTRSGTNVGSTSADKGLSEIKKRLLKSRSKKKLPSEVVEELEAMSGIDELRPISRPSRTLTPATVFKESPQKTEIVETVSALSNKAEDLYSLLKKTAYTAEERYNILEARDKLMRMKNAKTTDLASAQKNVGTCPDMCPEKERYHREAKHQVYCYEMHTSSIKQHVKMNARLAVKQYSRSSADQDMPLSHDLRPTPVLSMTMKYMLSHIVNRAEDHNENLRDWYFFLWDRTRSIRKDITQQELCDSETVTLLEQCARFHILCSEFLVDEDSSVFDPKINTENLTKCLQTLKYMYSDMALKEEACENEPEFQAYILLLNLNDTGRIVEEQKLNLVIQTTEPIKFALAVHAALSTNNYVKFFKLVKMATYLNACILHRYFTQVRIQALFTICKSYSFGSTKAQFSVNALKNILAFEDNEEAICFCEYYGLQVSPNGQEIILSGKTRIDVTSPPPALKRSIKIIASKKKCSIAEVISGGSLIECEYYKHHMPHNSFHDNGLLKLDAYDAIDQVEHLREDLLKELLPYSEKGFAHTEKGVVLNQLSNKESEVVTFSKEEITSKISEDQPVLYSKLYNEMTSATQPFKPSEEYYQEEEMPGIFQVSAPFIKQYCDTIIGDCISDMIRECYLIIIEEMRTIALQKAREELMFQNKKHFIDENARLVLSDLIDEVSEELIKETVLNLAKEIISEEIFYLLLDETIEGVVLQVMNDSRREQLNTITENIVKRRILHYVQKWKYKAHKMRKRREFLKSFTFVSTNLSLQEQANLLQVSGIPKQYSLRSQRLFSQKQSPLKLKMDVTPLPDIGILKINEIIEHVYTERLKEIGEDSTDVFWKIIISIPDKEESPYFSDITADWTEATLVDQPLCHNDIHLLESGILTKTIHSTELHENFGVCVQRSVGIPHPQGIVPNQVKHGGANGILFFVTSVLDGIDKSCRRLITLLRSLSKQPLLPVAVLNLQRPCPVRSCITEEWLTNIKKGKVIDNFKVFQGNIYSKENIKKMMVSALTWLASKRPSTLPVYSCYLPDLWEICLGETYWTRVNHSLVEKSVFVMQQAPNNILHLYNLTIDKLIDACLDEDVLDHSFGPPEFEGYLDTSNQDFVLKNGLLICPNHWGTPKYCRYLIDLLKSVHLPKTIRWPPINYTDLMECFTDYCKENDLHTAVWDLNSLFQDFVCNILETTEHNTNFEQLLHLFPWVKAVQVLVEHKLNNTDYMDPFIEGPRRKKVVVILKKSFIESYSTSPWWLCNEELFHLDPQSPKLPDAHQLEPQHEATTENLELTADASKEGHVEKNLRESATSFTPAPVTFIKKFNEDITLLEKKLKCIENQQGDILGKLKNQVITESRYSNAPQTSSNYFSRIEENLQKEMLEVMSTSGSDMLLLNEFSSPLCFEQFYSKQSPKNKRNSHSLFRKPNLEGATSISPCQSENYLKQLEQAIYGDQSRKHPISSESLSEDEVFISKTEKKLKRTRTFVEKAAFLSSQVRRLSSQQTSFLQELEKSISEDFFDCKPSEAKKSKKLL